MAIYLNLIYIYTYIITKYHNWDSTKILLCATALWVISNLYFVEMAQMVKAQLSPHGKYIF